MGTRDLDLARIIEKTHDFTEQLVKEDRFSGAVLIGKNGDIEYRHAFGLANKGFNIPNRVDTKFNLGSMNKMFTAVAIGQLAERGMLSFDDHVVNHLPHFTPEWTKRITIEQLLSHTSGLGLYWDNEKFTATWASLKTMDDYLKVIEEDALEFEPGSKFFYSNSGYVVLGAIIERVSGMSYFDYVKEYIFKPTGMYDTDSYDLEYDVPNLATGYTKHEVKDSSLWRNNLFCHVVKGNSAGGGYSTVDDLFRFSQALVNHRLLNPQMTSLFTTANVQNRIGPNMFYGYGFIEDAYVHDRVVSHNGGTLGVQSNLEIYTQRGYVIIVLGNYDMGTMKICGHFRALIDGDTEQGQEQAI